MKLLVFSPYYPPHIGGLESHAEEFNRHLAARGVEICVLTPRLPKEAPEKTRAEYGTVILRFPAFEPIHTYPVPKFWSPAFWKILREARAFLPDIVVSRTRFFSTSVCAVLFSKIRRIPHLHIEHGSDFVHFKSALKTRIAIGYDISIGRYILRAPRTVVANSLASAAFVKTLSKREAVVIYRGIETDRIEEIRPDIHSLAAKSGKTAIGFIGRLVDGKGVSLLLSALSKIERDDFVCYLVGDGPERAPLEAFVRASHLEKRVTFFGYQRPEHAISILKACDIIVNPSFSEGIPTSIIEAALCKKAIIASDVGGTREIITGNQDGCLVAPGNIPLLQEKLEYLLGSPEARKRFGENAFEAVKDRFNWSASADTYLNVFRGMLKKNS